MDKKRQSELKAAKKYKVIQESLDGKLSVAEASELLGLSERQIIRLRKGVQERGTDAVKHGNTGKVPSTTITTEQRQKITELYKTKYYGANFQHFTEMLDEYEAITVSANTTRQILNNEGIQSPRTKRKPRKHHRRKRREQEGALVQTDATPYEFFGTVEKYCLHGGIDDATGKILGLYMTKHECLEGYFTVFEQMIVDYGIPVSIYADRHTIFASPKADKLTIEEELAGKQVNDTQLGRAMRELGITLIWARSAQAKGRIERLWSTLQDRLVIEFRIRGITTMDAANAFLPEYIRIYNERFAVNATDAQSMFTLNTLDLVNILCVKETRKTDVGGAFSYYGKFFVVVGDITPNVSIEVIAHRKFGIFALYKGQRYDVSRIDKPKRKKAIPESLPGQRNTYAPADSHYHKHGKETFVQYSGEYSDFEILSILDQIFLKSFK